MKKSLVMMFNAVICISLYSLPLNAKVQLSQEQVWESWPYKATEKYISHTLCSEPTNEGRWEDNKYINYTALCIKVSVEQKCTCREFNTTYRKISGQTKYSFWTIGRSTEVPCPKSKKMSDECKKAADCNKTVWVSFEGADAGVKLSNCPDGTYNKNTDPAVTYMIGEVDLTDSGNKYSAKDLCTKCQLYHACNSKFENWLKVAGLWQQMCKEKFGVTVQMKKEAPTSK